MAQLQFTVRNQIIKRIDRFRVVSDSQNYLHAKFIFGTDDWDGIEKTAIFKKVGELTVWQEVQEVTNPYQPYEMLIDQNGECIVPHEVLEGGGEFTVSVFGGSLVTVNTAKVKVEQSGYSDDLESSTTPTPGIYEQLLSHVQNLEDIAEQVGDAEEAADRAEQAAATAGWMEMEIINGHLIYTRTSNVDVDFSIEDGHLVMEA